jgi:uncharacterized membrane protein YjjB (DUF3815 family)
VFGSDFVAKTAEVRCADPRDLPPVMMMAAMPWLEEWHGNRHYRGIAAVGIAAVGIGVVAGRSVWNNSASA